ncbi:MAG TPA: ABC transporter permease [Pseudomonadales bacterium]|jgi:oligopeptide transport system permease protein|nr:ABC transporter permease [Pseudomonadales bacterium]
MTQDTHGNLWRDVRRDMLKNPAALVGIITLLLIAVFCLSGRWWWRVDPNALDLTQISQAPHSGLLTTVITKNSLEKKSPDAIQQFQALLPANTEAVTLGWPTQQHRHFRLYRHILPPSDAQDLGLPLADFAANSQETVLQYQDALLLENRRYFYSLAVIDDSGNISSYQTISVDVAHATPIENLIQEGLLPSTANAPATLQLPAHPFGTDKLGRDLMARLIEGGRTSLFIGFTAPLLYVLFGALYGAMAGYRGGRTDTFMMAFADFMIALPFLLFVILLRIAFGIGPGDNGITALIVALLLLSWPNTARLVRAQVLQLRKMAYVDAARLQGASGFYIVCKHMLPNVLPSILVTLSFAIPSAIFTEAFLSFIGLGVTPPATSWGAMCNDGLSTLLTHPHELLFPAFFISITVLAFNLVGDALRDALDVQVRESRT